MIIKKVFIYCKCKYIFFYTKQIKNSLGITKEKYKVTSDNLFYSQIYFNKDNIEPVVCYIIFKMI